MKYNLKAFRKRYTRIPAHPEIRKLYSFPDRTIYINKDACPSANVILFEAPARQDNPVCPAPWHRG